MRRAVLVGALVGGCVGATDAPPPAGDAHEQFTQLAWPALGTCAGCHAQQPTIDFLAPGTVDEAYATVLAFQPSVVDLQTPSASLLLTMGKHTGPALDASAAPVVQRWLEQEKQERVPPASESIRVGPVQPVLGQPTSIELPGGSQLGFVASQVDGSLYLSQLAITAGTQGLHVAHPLFVSRPTNQPAHLDAQDRFGDVDVKMAAGDVLELGGGDAWFLDFAASDPLAIHFHALEVP